MSNSKVIISKIKPILARYPSISIAIVYGSVAQNRMHKNSDLDIAVAADHPLNKNSKLDLYLALH